MVFTSLWKGCISNLKFVSFSEDVITGRNHNIIFMMEVTPYSEKTSVNTLFFTLFRFLYEHELAAEEIETKTLNKT